MKTNFMQSVKTSDKTQRVWQNKSYNPWERPFMASFLQGQTWQQINCYTLFLCSNVFILFCVLYKFQFVRNDKQCIVAQLCTSKSLCVYICRINEIWSQQTIIPHECCFSNWSKFQIDKSIDFVCKIG